MHGNTSSEINDHGDNPDNITEGVFILTGDPKKAILKLSVPMMVAMLLSALYNLVDAIWVAGLGPDALAAVGFITPFFMILIGIGNGLGAGTTSAISRRIGARDKMGADQTAMHGIVITLITSVVLTVILIAFTKPLVLSLGAGNTADLAVEYGQIVFAGSVFLLFSNVAYGILRSEGDTKRTMYAMAASAVLNMVLDPILIYSAGMGIAGAAWATVISIALVNLVLLYWFFIKKDTYVTLSRAKFLPDAAVARDILGVSIPASCEFLMMSILISILNIILVGVAGTDGVAVYTSGWRIVMFALVPLISIGASVAAVVGASYGARRYENISFAHIYSVKLGFAISLGISVLTWLFAPQIAMLFTYTPETAVLAPTIADFLRVMCMFYIFVSPGMISSMIFQGTGKGLTSLFLNFLRNLVFIAIFAYMFAIVMGMGETGVWWGIVAGNILAGFVGYAWARLYINRLIGCNNRHDVSDSKL